MNPVRVNHIFHYLSKWAITLMLSCCGLLSRAQVHADFDAVIKSGCSPLQISFSNLSTTGQGISYQWFFGNGNSSVQFEPYAIFTNPGSYNITLVVSDGSQSDTLVRYGFITVFSSPVADFYTPGPKSGCAPYETSFINTSVPGSSPVTAYAWDFGDGMISPDAGPDHVYTFAGIFNVSLMITDSNGCNGSKIRENYIQVFKPHSYFSTNLKSSCNGNLTSSFTCLSNGSAPLTYSWDFGDGNTSSQYEPVHFYDSSGNFTVSLVTTDSLGCSDTLIRNNYISIIEVMADFSVSDAVSCKNEIIQFTDLSQNTTSAEWDFGDGSFYSGHDPVHAYSSSDSYPVKLKVSRNGQCADSVIIPVTVEYVKAAFHVSSDFGCELPFHTQYIDSSVNAVTWDWKLGSGVVSHVQYPFDSIIGFASGSTKVFSAQLNVTSPNGCLDSVKIDTCITIVLPSVSFSPPWGNSISGCTPRLLDAVNQTTYDTDRDSIVSWSWDYGGGVTSHDWNGYYEYTSAGNYLVMFTLTTASGCMAQAYTSVGVGTPQVPLFSPNVPDSVCASDVVEFQNLSHDQGLINNYFWNFGDQSGIVFDKNPSHSFTDTGWVDVSLSVSYNGCLTTLDVPSLFYVKGPYTTLSKYSDCANPLDYDFTANIRGSDSYYWKFGAQDSGNFNMPQFTHTFPGSGNYTVQLLSENTTTGCKFHSEASFDARVIKADFTMTETYGCQGAEIIFNGSVSQDETYDAWFNLYKWYFSATDEHVSMSNADGIITHVFNNPGDQFVTLAVQDINGCTDMISKDIRIYKPVVKFSTEYQTGCMPVEFIFRDSTVSDTVISTWLWNFGDSTTSAAKEPVHEYQSFGVYDITLKVTDTLGCTGELVKTGYIHAVMPEPAFFASDSTLCKGDSVFFAKSTSTKVLSYEWDFGDGTFSMDSVPFHLFADTGLYTITLHITDIHYCDTTAVMDHFISVQQPPDAAFTTDAVASNCYPFQVHFTDASSSGYLSNWKWGFGDNFTASEMQNPVHTYFRPGGYDVSLIAYTSNGCSDTIVKDSLIRIEGPWARIEATDTVCRGDSVRLHIAEKMNVYGIKWDFGNGISGYEDTVFVAYVNYGTVYPSVILYSDSNHICDKVITDTINIFELVPNFTVNNGDHNGCTPFYISCEDKSSRAETISWYVDNLFQSGQVLYSDTLSIPGDYIIRQVVWNHFGCKDSISKSVTVFPLPVMGISHDSIICRGQEIQLSASGGIKYSWQPSDELNYHDISNPVATPGSSVLFQVRIEDSNGCADDTSVMIRVFQVPVITMRDTSVVIGEYVQLHAFNPEIQSYSWSPAASLSCNSCDNPLARPFESTEYTVTVTDTMNCFTVDFMVHVDIMKKYSVDVPELFTPNGDGINDVISVRGWGIKELAEFRIFNRWGELVFETTDLNMGWDGIYKGEMQHIETFMYTVKVVSFNNETISKKGFIKLIR